MSTATLSPTTPDQTSLAARVSDPPRTVGLAATVAQSFTMGYRGMLRSATTPSSCSTSCCSPSSSR